MPQHASNFSAKPYLCGFLILKLLILPMQPAFESGMCEHVISFIGCALESPEVAANAALCRRFIITLLDCGARRGVSSLRLWFADKEAWEGKHEILLPQNPMYAGCGCVGV